MQTALSFSLEDLTRAAREFEIPDDLPIDFESKPYARCPIYRDEDLEIVVVCFGPGQTSSVHDHQGSKCVVRVVGGKILELLFARDDEGTQLTGHHYLQPGDISPLDETSIHQLANMHPVGSILINFYSPPFRM